MIILSSTVRKCEKKESMVSKVRKDDRKRERDLVSFLI